MRKKILITGMALVLLALPGWIDAAKPSDELAKLPGISKDPNSLIVMTRNIYVGANVDRIVEAQDPNDIPILVAITFQEMLSTNFLVRVEALVDEIELSMPHVIGVQEGSIIRYQSPGDSVYGGTIPATDVLFNYMEILMAALANRNLDYYLVGAIENADIEVPMLVSPPPNLAFDDVRLTDYDFLLARGDVTSDNLVTKNYQSVLAIPGTPIIIPRGYVAADVTVGHKTYRVLNTHLEPFVYPGSPNFKLEQAMEMIADLQSETLPTILLGDFNTAPGWLVYDVIESYGFVDAWTRNQVQPVTEGLTNPHDADLRNTVVDFDKRIDLVWVRSNVGINGMHNIGPVFSWVVGDELDDRVWIEFPAGVWSQIWPSDHAGVIALLRIPIPGYNR